MRQYEGLQLAAIVFVCVLPLFVCAGVAWYLCGRCPRWYVSKRTTYYGWVLGQAVLVGFVLSFWLHLVPCFWTACDLSPDDDVLLRALLWGVGWMGFSLIVCIPCLFTRSAYGIVSFVPQSSQLSSEIDVYDL